MFVEGIRFLGRDAVDEIESAHRGRAPHLGDDIIDRALALARDHAAHRPRSPDLAREGAGVDALNRADAMLRKIIGERHLRMRARGLIDDIAHDESGHLRRRALIDDRFDAVVADVRIRHGDDLKSIGRIGRDFLIAGQRSVEDNFADGVVLRSK